jgi:hypothetical protein
VEAEVEFSVRRNGVESYLGNFLGLEDIMANEKEAKKNKHLTDDR